MSSTEDALRHDNSLLRAAIIKHRDQKADDRCWMDDQELYAVLGDDNIGENHVGDKAQMMANCYRFIENRCESGRWTSYIELEKELNDAHNLLDEFRVDPRRGWRESALPGGIVIPMTRSLVERIKLLVEKFSLKAQS